MQDGEFEDGNEKRLIYRTLQRFFELDLIKQEKKRMNMEWKEKLFIIVAKGYRQRKRSSSRWTPKKNNEDAWSKMNVKSDTCNCLCLYVSVYVCLCRSLCAIAWIFMSKGDDLHVWRDRTLEIYLKQKDRIRSQQTIRTVNLTKPFSLLVIQTLNPNVICVNKSAHIFISGDKSS